MITVVTGMVGLDKKSYLSGVESYAHSLGKDIEVCNVGDMMYAEAQDVASGRILDIPMQRLNAIRRSVFKDIIERSKQVEHLIVNTHATFRWRHGLFPAVDFDQMRQLNADMYVCVIDGVAALHKRLEDNHQNQSTLKDLIVWREEEIIGTEMLCRGIGGDVEFYCLGRGESVETTVTFYRLMFERWQRKTYLSFPMTLVVDMPGVQEQINRFRASMKELFICFDPGDLEEAYLPGYARSAAEGGKKEIVAEAGGGKVTLEIDEVLGIERDINSQTYARDFMLIDQADMIVSFIPETAGGEPAISSGVERELQHAHESGRDVYVIWTAAKSPSIFVTQTADKVFTDIGEAMGFFEKLSSEHRKEDQFKLF